MNKKLLAAKLSALAPFDPYNSPLCTCKPKLSLNVYSGCGFECRYCYASAYQRGRWGRIARWGPKANLRQNLLRDIRKIETQPALAELKHCPVALSLSSDPYPTCHISEQKLGHTRWCIERLAEAGFALLVQTKSDLVTRDLDVLPRGRTVVGLTITTLKADLARRLEPLAPPPARRIAALETAARAGHKTLCRIDPIIPGLNDSPREVAKLLKTLAAVGVNQVVSSTFKMRRDSAARMLAEFPEAAVLEQIYCPRDRSGYRFLDETRRRSLMQMIRDIALEHGLNFSCCREGMPDLNTAHCDGQGLLTARSKNGATR